MPTILAVVGDLHVGSATAICPPTAVLGEGHTVAASESQRWLWDLWKDFWQRVKRRRQRGCKLVVVLNGDLVEGAHHALASGYVTPNVAEQLELSDLVLDAPLSLKPDGVFIVRGTETHVGPSAAWEELLASRLSARLVPVVVNPETESRSWWHLRLNVEDVKFDIAHHTRGFARPWTRGVAASIAAEILAEYAIDAELPPHVVVRSHLHRVSDSGETFPNLRVVTLPGWQLHTPYTRRIAPESLADIGGLIVSADGGAYNLEIVRHRARRSLAWQQT